MFLDFYGLREQPFGVTANPQFLYESKAHREALAALRYGVENDLGFHGLIAEPGLGKTTLLLRMLELLRGTALTAFLFETQCDSTALLRYLLRELEVSTDEKDPVALQEKLREVLVCAARNGRRIILIIDEAQNLEPPVLETIRLLSNFESQRAKLIHIILSGQRRLAEQLARSEMTQLQQRLSMTSWLTPLPLDEVAGYIKHRLRVAGYAGENLFSELAIETIAIQSEGIPRKINRNCFNALTLGCAMGEMRISKEIVEEAADSKVPWLAQQKAHAEKNAPRKEGSQSPLQLPRENRSVMTAARQNGGASVSQPIPFERAIPKQLKVHPTHRRGLPWSYYGTMILLLIALIWMINEPFRRATDWTFVLGEKVVRSATVFFRTVLIVAFAITFGYSVLQAQDMGTQDASGKRFSPRTPRYQICPADVIDLSFFPSTGFNQTVTVQPDGFITLREVGDVHVLGKTLPELKEAVTAAYAHILNEPVITVSLKEFEKPHFTVGGQVGHPGKFDLRADTTVTEAIAIAGGFTEKAKHSQVLLFRRVSDEWVEAKSLDIKTILKGQFREDVHLHPGDMLYVPQNRISKIKPFIPVYSVGTYMSGL